MKNTLSQAITKPAPVETPTAATILTAIGASLLQPGEAETLGAQLRKYNNLLSAIEPLAPMKVRDEWHATRAKVIAEGNIDAINAMHTLEYAQEKASHQKIAFLGAMNALETPQFKAMRKTILERAVAAMEPVIADSEAKDRELSARVGVIFRPSPLLLSIVKACDFLRHLLTNHATSNGGGNPVAGLRVTLPDCDVEAIKAAAAVQP